MALLTITAMGSIRGLPAMTPYGLATILPYIVSGLVFLVLTKPGNV